MFKNFFDSAISYDYLVKKGSFLSGLDKMVIVINLKKPIFQKDILRNLILLELITFKKGSFSLKKSGSNRLEVNDISAKLYITVSSEKEISFFLEKLYLLMSLSEKSSFFKSWVSRKNCHLSAVDISLLLDITNRFKLEYLNKREEKINLYLFFKDK